MTYKDGVRIASRLLAIYFLADVVSVAIFLPQGIMNFSSAVQMLHSSPMLPNRYLQQSLVMLAMSVGRIALFLLAAIWFYKCGPLIQKFFGCDMSQEPTTTEIGQ
jgi:hypothetical protein